MSFLNLGSRSPCRYQNIRTIVDPHINKMHTAKNTFSGRGGGAGKTNELIIVTRIIIDVITPTTRLIIRSRAEVSPNRGLLSRPPLVPYVRVVKSSMSTNKCVSSQHKQSSEQQHVTVQVHHSFTFCNDFSDNHS